MAVHRSACQPDLFESVPRRHQGYAAALDEPLPADFIERIRNELTNTLATARAAPRMPWKDWTAATLTELRFKSIANWLPEAEADTLREEFAREMARFWEIAVRKAPEED